MSFSIVTYRNAMQLCYTFKYPQIWIQNNQDKGMKIYSVLFLKEAKTLHKQVPDKSEIKALPSFVKLQNVFLANHQ